MRELKAFTLLESVVAMVIITMVFLSASYVVSNAAKGSQSVLRIKASSEMDRIFILKEKEVRPIAEEFDLEEFVVDFEVEVLERQSNLYRFVCKAHKEDKPAFFERSRIIYKGDFDD